MALPDPSDSSTALVTGASSGIGAAIARELAGRGHNLILVARREDRLRRARGRARRGEHGVRAEAIAADLGDAMASATGSPPRSSELGLDGRGPRQLRRASAASATCTATTASAWSRWSGSTATPCSTSRRATAPAMVERGRGAIVNVASTAAFQPMPGNATYAATKAFVLSLERGDARRALAARASPSPRVCPGPVKTEFADVAGIGDSEERVPGFVWTPVEDVARAAVEGAERGRASWSPGCSTAPGRSPASTRRRALALPLVKRIWRRAL